MVFVSVEDFLKQASAISPLSRKEEKALGQEKAAGSKPARDTLIKHYLPHVAAAIKHAPKEIQTLNTVYTLIATLEKGVDDFNFSQEGETFSHHLSFRLRQCITRAIADRY
jgi:DNA-directed RNA polymerase sigma subunit (sigma70/sigma32)